MWVNLRIFEVCLRRLLPVGVPAESKGVGVEEVPDISYRDVLRIEDYNLGLTHGLYLWRVRTVLFRI